MPTLHDRYPNVAAPLLSSAHKKQGVLDVWLERFLSLLATTIILVISSSGIGNFATCVGDDLAMLARIARDPHRLSRLPSLMCSTLQFSLRPMVLLQR